MRHERTQVDTSRSDGLDEAAHPLDAMLRRTREIILGADDRVTESIKWKTPTFEFKGNIASFNPSKRFVSLLFHRGAEIPGDHPRLEGELGAMKQELAELRAELASFRRQFE